MRLLLDSNIWRYLVDEGSIGEIDFVVRRGRSAVVVAPAVLFEAAHTPDGALRNRLLAAMIRPSWKRLMPEAYSEAEELRTEIRRLRPEWLRPVPNLTLQRRIKHDWLRRRGGLWDRIVGEAELLQRSDGFMLKRARTQAHELREDAKGLPTKWETATLTKTMGSLPEPREGWNGLPFEAWRFDAMNVFATAIRTLGNPAIDWIDGDIDIQMMDSQSASLVRFWLDDVELAHMPRHWLRWAFEFLQRLRKVTDGTPGDSQLAMYLLDADKVLSADKNFVWMATPCRMDAPFAGVAEPVLLAGGTSASAKVLQLLRDA